MRLVALAEQQAGLDYEQGRGLLEALRRRVHERLGYGSLSEYVEVLFGHSPRQTGERLRVAEALEQLPELTRALRAGELCWSVIRELSRVATADNELEWLADAEGKTARDVEQAVSGKEKGQGPKDPSNPEVRTHMLRFEVTAQTLATFRDAVDKLRRDTGEKLDQEEALMLMARQALVGPGQAGRAGYQVAMTVCESCQQGFQEAGGALVPVAEEVVEMALCDPQIIGHVDGSSSPSGDRGAGEVATHVGTIDETGESGDTHMGKSQAAIIPTRPPRATQSIAPAVARTVRRRQKGCCAVPGCRCSIYLELHHLRYRHDGKCGPDESLGLCYAHHLRVHQGLLMIDGTFSRGLHFYHADGSEYGRREVSAPLLAIREQAVTALEEMGFRKKQVQRALAKAGVCATGTAKPPSLEQVLRQALAILT